jgi:glycosyltransferase involved in cell wall biosynthesis
MINRTEQDITSRWDLTAPMLVSISCATYNHEKYISKAVDGFLKQETDFPFEIIIGEDKSTDETLKILKKYQEKYPNIVKLIQWPENVGAKKNWATILQTCTGKYIANCEGDDYWTDPNKLQLQVDAMEQLPSCNISFHPAQQFNEDTNMFQDISVHSDSNKLFSCSEIILGDGNFCPSSSLVFKKQLLDNFPDWFHTAPVGDYFLQILGSLEGGALYIHKNMSVYRHMHQNSWSSTQNSFEHKSKTTVAIIKALDQLNESLNRHYQNEITAVQTRYYLEILRNQSFNRTQREEFFKIHRKALPIKEQILWYIYRNSYAYKTLAFIKRKFKQRIVKLKQNFLHLNFKSSGSK